MRKLGLFSCSKQYLKLIAVLVLTVTMVLPSTATASGIQAFYADHVGDVNQDGTVNSLDYGCMRAYLVGKKEYSEIGERIWEADLNGDGVVNSLDFACFRLWLVKGTKFPKVLKLINTVITTVEEEPLDLIAWSPMDVLEFSVILQDEAGNPLAGKTIKWANHYNSSENTAITDENGCATFSFRIPHTDRVPFTTYEIEVHVYFYGDEKYNGCEYIAKAITSNNGGPQRTTSPIDPTPTPR